MELLHELSLGTCFAGLAILSFFYVVAKAVYNITFHPLAKYPGPLSRTAFAFPGLWNTFKGHYVRDVWAAHQKYGKVVRIAPDMLSFSTAKAWKDIYGLQNGKHQLAKDFKRFPDRPEAIHLFGSNDEDHKRIRRIIATGFTGQALRQQIGLIEGHIATLMQKLEEQIGEKVDVNHLFNIFSFDIMSHLTFGESFNSVPTGQLHPFTADFFEKTKIFPIIYVSREYTVVNLLMKMMMSIPAVKKQQKEFFEATKVKVNKRIAQSLPNQHDFMKYILESNDEKGMSKSEIEGTTTVLLNAGGQETATCLSSTLFYLLRSENALRKAREDAATEGMPYIGAAINEALRVHPPVSGNIQRRTGQEGHIVDGYFVPPGTSVGVNQFAACHLSENFAFPDDFAPERWLPEAPRDFRNDDRGACQPFSVGPRNCVGKSLALAVASRTLAQILCKFEIELCDHSKEWDEGQTFDVGWNRPPLFVVLQHRS